MSAFFHVVHFPVVYFRPPTVHLTWRGRWMHGVVLRVVLSRQGNARHSDVQEEHAHPATARGIGARGGEAAISGVCALARPPRTRARAGVCLALPCSFAQLRECCPLPTSHVALASIALCIRVTNFAEGITLV